MSTNEQPENETERGPKEDKVRRAVGRWSNGGYEVPLFLRGRSDGWKGDAQDEKDEVEE